MHPLVLAGAAALAPTSQVPTSTNRAMIQDDWSRRRTLDNVDGQMVGTPVVAVPQLSSGHTTPAATLSV